MWSIYTVCGLTASILTVFRIATFDSLFTKGQAGHLQLPRLSLAGSQVHHRRHESHQHPCARLQREGKHQTPRWSLAIRNQVDRFNLAIDVIDRVPRLQGPGAHLKEWLKAQIIEKHRVRGYPKVWTSLKFRIGSGPQRNDCSRRTFSGRCSCPAPKRPARTVSTQVG